MSMCLLLQRLLETRMDDCCYRERCLVITPLCSEL